MALQKVGAKALAVVEDDKKKFVPPKPPKKVLDEDAYTESLEKIIVRDFYPDLPKLEAQKEYLDALETNNVRKLREIHLKYGPKVPTATPNIYATPATFETPDVAPKQTPKPSDGKDDTSQRPADAAGSEDDGPTHNPEPAKKKAEEDLPLDKFMATVTSEDNASFGDLMKENEEKHRLKHAWLYEQEQEKKQMKETQLALPPIEQQAITESNSEVKTWEYTNRNTVMYNPDGAVETAAERVEKAKGNPREIVHGNTRFDVTPFDARRTAEMTAQSAAAQAQLKLGKIGHDGKELLPEQSPQVNGWGFVATPSPAPGVSESPLMTWGEIDGTPFRLDGGGGATPLGSRTPGPVFKMPAVPRRDELGLQLAEKASRAHRAKKEAALKQVSSRLQSPSPKFGSASKTERIQNMSPAAQRLANTRLGIRTHTDKALRASYTPSPSHRHHSSKTPTPTKTPKGATPTPGVRTPKSVLRTPGASTPKSSATPEQQASLTDNLLFLPKRPRVEDPGATQTPAKMFQKPRAEDFF